MPKIDPKLMEELLSHANWNYTTVAGREFLDRLDLFPPPAPEPDPALAVPVDVQALYVPTSHSERYIKLPFALGGKAGTDEVSDVFSAPVARPRGVHLHWALPDALLRGEMRENDEQHGMRALPNRWLVVRTAGFRGATSLNLTCWVLESERGRVYRLEDWPDGDPINNVEREQLDPNELNGLSGGSPNWTAGYDAATNRFSFHDPLQGFDTRRVLTGTVSYTVMGWWSQRNHDPLANCYWPFAVSRQLANLDWTASTAPSRPAGSLAVDKGPVIEIAEQREREPADITLLDQLQFTASQAGLAGWFQEYVPSPKVFKPLRTEYQTIMHGSVYGVPVRGRVQRDLAPRASQIGLSMAPTLERLLAAQASAGLRIAAKSKREYFEGLMTAVANGSILDIGSRDGIVRLDEAEHADGFEAFTGPDRYEDVIIDRDAGGPLPGRQARSADARGRSAKPLKADLIWGRDKKRGKTRGGVFAQRERQRSETDRKQTGIGGEAIPATRRVRRPGPRYHRQGSPVVGLRNFGRTNRFSDHRFDKDGDLVCRWVEELPTRYTEFFEAADYLPSIGRASLPSATDRILQDSLVFNLYAMPWTLEAVRIRYSAETAEATGNRLKGEMALRFSKRGEYDGSVPLPEGSSDRNPIAKYELGEELRRFSVLEGREPSPVAITSWAQPWCPIWLEWELELEPGKDLDGWQLGRVEFLGESEKTGARLRMRGRSPVTSGLARKYQGVISDYLQAEAQRDENEEGELATGHQDALADLAEFFGSVDLGSVTFDQLDEAWLGLEIGPDGQEQSPGEILAESFKAAGLPRLLASGALRLTRARLIDTFGRFRDLRVDRLVTPVALETLSVSGDKAMSLPPRLTLPARLMWRFVDPADPGPAPASARLDQVDESQSINPIAGYLLPDFMDESVEFFDADGNPLGELMHDSATGGVAWEGAVGREGPASTLPGHGLPDEAILCGKMAQGLIDADLAQRMNSETAQLESPLSAFLRAVDTTMWTVDQSLVSAGATIAGLVGRPVAIVSSQLWLDVPEDLSLTGAYGEQADAVRTHLIKHAVFEAVKQRAFDVRLGELSKGHDGLYGYFIGDDFSRFYLVEKEVRSATRKAALGQGFRSMIGAIRPGLGDGFIPPPDPIDTPYIDASEPLSLHSGQRIRLTLLMHPASRVHATTGILPRKSLELLRQWVMPGLQRIAPSARIGPVLIDPDKVRLPKIAAFGPDQLWTRRNTPVSWKTDPILSATQAAILPEGPVRVEEGYIRIAPLGPEEES